MSCLDRCEVWVKVRVTRGQKSGPSMVVFQRWGLQQCPGGSVFSLPDSQPPQLEQQPASQTPALFPWSVGPIGRREGVCSRSCRFLEVLNFFFVSIPSIWLI